MGLSLQLDEWDFLLEVPNAFGSCVKFIQLIRECISSFDVSYYILLNGPPSEISKHLEGYDNETHSPLTFSS